MTEPATIERRHRERYGVLLGALVLAFGIQGIAQPGRWEQLLVSVLLAVTLLLAFWAADAKVWVMRASMLVVAVVVLLSLAEAIQGNVDDEATRIANLLLVVLAPPAIVVGVLRSMRARQAVTLEAVFGVLCVYILLGMFFAYTYGLINDLGGSPFFAGGQQATVARCLYYSFTTLTTVGYGDLTARSNLGHTLSTSEALLGQIYLITVVSLLVSNLRPRRAPERSHSGGEREHPG
jgi:Ion channel